MIGAFLEGRQQFCRDLCRIALTPFVFGTTLEPWAKLLFDRGERGEQIGRISPGLLTIAVGTMAGPRDHPIHTYLQSARS